MSEQRIPISQLAETQTAPDASYIAIDDGSLTKKITVENFNSTSTASAQQYATQAAASAQTVENNIATSAAQIREATLAAREATQASTSATESATSAYDSASLAQNYSANAATSAGQAMNAADSAAQSFTASKGYAEDSEAWAVGQRNGSDVPASDETYQNNAKYYANSASGSATRAEAAAQSINVPDTTLTVSGVAADSKVVGDRISAADTEITELKNDINYLNDTVLDYEELTFTSGAYIRNDTVVGGTVDTTPITNGIYDCLKYPCKAGQRFIININGGSSARAYSFIDSSNKQLVVATDSANYTNALVVAPSDGYIICNKKSAQSDAFVKADYFKVEEDVERLMKYEDEIYILGNLLKDATYTAGQYYSTGYGNTASLSSLGTFSPITLKPNTTYTVRSAYESFTWLKKSGTAGEAINTLSSFVDNGNGTCTFTTWDIVGTITLYMTIADANKNNAYLTEYSYVPIDAGADGFVYIPNLALGGEKGTTLLVSKSYTLATSGYGVSKFSNVIDAVNAITDSSESNPYTILVEAGTADAPIIYDEWNTAFAGHASSDATYVGVKLPSYVTITTTSPTHPDRTVFYFDGHVGISDTMTYNDAFKKCLFHIDGRKMGIVVEGVTLRSKDCRYAFHPESGVDGYGVDWKLKNCIIDWQGSPHSSETGWAGTTAVGVGLGYGGRGEFENCKWLTQSGVTTAIGGHTNGWNPGVSALPTMPGATIKIKNCDFGGYNVFMQNTENGNELNNILDFYNVVNCSGNSSNGWVEILQATVFSN